MSEKTDEKYLFGLLLSVWHSNEGTVKRQVPATLTEYVSTYYDEQLGGLANNINTAFYLHT
jgi:hypothetical protein